MTHDIVMANAESDIACATGDGDGIEQGRGKEGDDGEELTKSGRALVGSMIPVASAALAGLGLYTGRREA